MRLQNQVALITGAGRGIGAAVARRFAAEGARVVINDWGRTTEAFALAAQIKAEGGSAIAIRADVANAADVQAMLRAAKDRFGPVDILVNNAAVYPRQAWDAIGEADWDRVLGVNLKGTFLCTQAALPDMIANGRGKVINVSSVTFWTGQAGFLHYVASKGGVIGLTRALAREVGRHGICVNAITPGAVQTEAELEEVPPGPAQAELAAMLAEQQSIPRREVPTDLVGTFVYLASPDSDFVTGQTINVDGGWAMH